MRIGERVGVEGSGIGEIVAIATDLRDIKAEELGEWSVDAIRSSAMWAAC